MENERKKMTKLVHALLCMGEALVSCGAEIFRVEDTLNRVGYAYGASNMNVFVITSSIVITMEMPDGQLMTHTRRIRNANGTDFTRLEKLNELSREISSSPLPPEKLEERIKEIASGSCRKRELLAGYVLASAFFTVFFGGSLYDAAAAGVVGVFIWILAIYLMPFCMNNVVYQFSASLLSGLLICVAAKIFPGLSMEHIMIGDIMLLIPGIMFTNSLRDVLLGDTISGAMRLIEAILLTFALVLGFVAAIWIIGRAL